MTLERMRVMPYTGAVWDGPGVHPDLWNLLLQRDVLIEIASGQPPYQVTLGIPHHAAPGVDRIAGDWVNPKNGKAGRPADETTGLFGLAVFTRLRERNISCRLVIAVHPTDHDPNKTPGCPYWESVFTSPKPGLLLELHGAGNHRRHALELSAGRNHAAAPLIFGRVLAYFWDGGEMLAVQEKPGSSTAQLFEDHRQVHPEDIPSRLQNPALETLSLIYAGQLGVPALHLEVKSAFRQPDPAYPAAPRPSAAAWELATALASTLEILTRPDEPVIAARNLGLDSSAFLARPAKTYEKSYLSAAAEASPAEIIDNEDLGIRTHEDFARLVRIGQQVIYDGLPEQPPEEYLWLIDQGEVIGRVFFLHWLNEFRLQTDGQVDYWVRPSKRRQGYGRLLLRLTLERFRQLGLERILITCLEENISSRKIIESNGGVFQDKIMLPDASGQPRPRLRYWITI